LDYDEETKKYPTLEKFTAETGIAHKYFEDYNDNDEFYGKVQAQLGLGEDIGYDVVTPTDWMAARWIRLGYAQQFDVANIPNKSNILDSLASPSFDPNREKSLTWQGIMAGFGWNTEKNPNGISTLDELFAPQNKGKIVVLSEMRDTIGIILLAQGVNLQTVTEDQFMKNEGKFDFAIPESGGTISGDNLMIPSTASAEGKANAEKLINFYYDPAIAAEVAAYVNYVCPVKGAQAEMEKIAPELASSPFIFPDDAMSKRLNVFRSLTPAEETSWTEAFQKAAGN